MIYFINENMVITHVLTISLRVSVLLIYAVRKKIHSVSTASISAHISIFLPQQL